MTDDKVRRGRPPHPDHWGGHGTERGYSKHRKDRTPTCKPCRDAHAAYVRQYRKRRIKQKKILMQILKEGNTNLDFPDITEAELTTIIKSIKKDLEL